MTTGKRTTTRRVPAKRNTALSLVSDTTEYPVLRYPFRFSDVSRELAWKRLWDEIYAELLPVVVGTCHEEQPAA